MDQFTVFIGASVIVISALLYSLVQWIRIRTASSSHARTAATFFALCFGLYVVGQSIVVLDALTILEGMNGISSYLYALAALLFAAGSYFQVKSVMIGK